MPYRNIYEKDYTRPVSSAAGSNFAVLVPGFVGDGTPDEDTFVNGVAEFDTQADFTKKIGKRNALIEYAPGHDEKDATAPVIAELSYPADGETIAEADKVTITFNETTIVLVKRAYEIISDSIEGKTLVQAIINEEQDPTTFGELKLGNCVFEEIHNPVDTEKYIVLDSIGNDHSERVPEVAKYHFGNQIAYELLGLGYHILFKKLESLDELSNHDFYAGLDDKSVYNFRYILSGLRSDNTDANEELAKLATLRGDIIALLDLDENCYLDQKIQSNPLELAKSITNTITNNLQHADTNSTILAPSLKLYMADDSVYKNKTLPMSLYYLACAKYALENNYKEWYAVAGYRRGICRYTIDKPLLTVGETLVNKLSPRRRTDIGTNPGGGKCTVSKACNLVALIKGNYYIWGNRTAEPLGEPETGELSAKHYLNIRQLITTLKQELYTVLTSKTFNPNSDTLWYSFKSAITPVLETMVNTDGIADYEIRRSENTQKGTMSAIIRLVPIEAVEDFEITISLENSLEETGTILE